MSVIIRLDDSHLLGWTEKKEKKKKKAPPPQSVSFPKLVKRTKPGSFSSSGLRHFEQNYKQDNAHLSFEPKATQQVLRLCAMITKLGCNDRIYVTSSHSLFPNVSKLWLRDTKKSDSKNRMNVELLHRQIHLSLQT